MQATDILGAHPAPAWCTYRSILPTWLHPACGTLQCGDNMAVSIIEVSLQQRSSGLVTQRGVEVLVSLGLSSAGPSHALR